uniref:Uncharacterized protein n=1 Tax=Anguilla anguilla TaxID=7936 RepID=A0A0E9V175_ANGAN
MLKITGLFKL